MRKNLHLFQGKIRSFSGKKRKKLLGRKKRKKATATNDRSIARPSKAALIFFLEMRMRFHTIGGGKIFFLERK